MSKVIEATDFIGLPSINASNWITHLLLKGYRGFDDGEDFEAVLAEVGLSEQGKRIAERIKGRDFIDLACGNPKRSPVPRVMARIMGAKRYLGVDADWGTLVSTRIPTKPSDEEMVFGRKVHGLFKSQVECARVGEEEGLPVAWMEDDALGFLAKIPELNGVVFTICALQIGMLSNRERYYHALVDEIDRLTQDGDIVLLAQADKPLVEALIDKGFDYDHSESKNNLADMGVFTKRNSAVAIAEATRGQLIKK